MSVLDQIKKIRRDRTLTPIDRGTRLSLIAEATTDSMALEALSTTIFKDIVANNRACPSEVLRKLSNDRSSIVRSRVAGNPSTPKDVLAELINDRPDVKRMLAKNEEIPENLLTILSYEKNDAILYYVLTNPKCTQEIRDRLGPCETYQSRWWFGGPPK
jgi:hypothetical protein